MCQWSSLQAWEKEFYIFIISGVILFILLYLIVADLKSQQSSTSSTTIVKTEVTPTSITKITNITTVTKIKQPQEGDAQDGTYKQYSYQNLMSSYCGILQCNSFISSLCKSVCRESTQMSYPVGGAAGSEVLTTIMEGYLDKLSVFDIFLLLLTWPVGIVFIRIGNSLVEKLHSSINKK